MHKLEFDPNSLPEALRGHLIKNEEVHRYPTRNCADVRLEKKRTNLGQSSPRYIASNLWNKLDKKIKNLRFGTFVNHIRKYFIDSYKKSTTD